MVLGGMFSKTSSNSSRSIAPYSIIFSGHLSESFSMTSLQMNRGLPSLSVSQHWCREPLDSPASTTIVPSEINAIVLFRSTKSLGLVTWSTVFLRKLLGGACDALSSCSPEFVLGVHRLIQSEFTMDCETYLGDGIFFGSGVGR